MSQQSNWMLPGDRDDKVTDGTADINITAQGDRRTLEALYLELRELVKARGLKIEYRLSLINPEQKPQS